LSETHPNINDRTYIPFLFKKLFNSFLGTNDPDYIGLDMLQ